MSLGFVLGCTDSGSIGSGDGKGTQYLENTIPGSEVELSAVSNNKCLDLQKYFSIISSISTDVQARRVVTSVNSNNYSSSNYPLRMAIGNFDLTDKPLRQMEDISAVTQVGCETVTVPNSGGGDEFKITKSTQDSVTMTNMWDEQLTYSWVSPTHMKITHTFIAPDNCETKSKAKVTTVTHLMWDANSQSEALDASLFDSDYLNMLSRATGYPKAALYSNSTGTPLAPEPSVTTNPVVPDPVLPADPNAPPPPPEDTASTTTPPAPGTTVPPVVTVPGASLLDAHVVESPAQSLSVTRLRNMSQVAVSNDLMTCR
jgi:hypothetical protein